MRVPAEYRSIQRYTQGSLLDKAATVGGRYGVTAVVAAGAAAAVYHLRSDDDDVVNRRVLAGFAGFAGLIIGSLGGAYTAAYSRLLLRSHAGALVERRIGQALAPFESLPVELRRYPDVLSSRVSSVRSSFPSKHQSVETFMNMPASRDRSNERYGFERLAQVEQYAKHMVAAGRLLRTAEGQDELAGMLERGTQSSEVAEYLANCIWKGAVIHNPDLKLVIAHELIPTVERVGDRSVPHLSARAAFVLSESTLHDPASRALQREAIALLQVGATDYANVGQARAHVALMRELEFASRGT